MNKLQPRPKQQKSGGCLKIFGCIVLILILTPVIGYFSFQSWYNSQVNNPVGDGSTTETITIEEGKGLLDISPTLVEKGLLTDNNALRIYLYLEKPELDIKVGNYKLNNGLNIPELIEKLNAGPIKNSLTFTVPEGLRIDEVAAIVTGKYNDLETPRFEGREYRRIINNPQNFDFSTSVQEFLDTYKPADKNLEGFLFPDTYVVGTDASAQEVVELQISTLIRRLGEADIDPSKDSRAGNFYNSLKLATIVEREARQAETKRTVADIFLKRLENNIVLAADSTYLYTVKDWKYPLTSTELQTNYDNKYNTYVYAGLTPTPIGNPGIDAIKAVYKPKRNPYFYFITDPSGVNRYAETLAGHQANINQYL